MTTNACMMRNMLCWQNLGEAEMAVSIYMYMRLRGYPAAQISILSPYNGQVALLRDVVERRCAQHPAFGRPHKVRFLTSVLWLQAAAWCLRDAQERACTAPKQSSSWLKVAAGSHGR